jgi:hypothetical protein
VFGQVPRNVQRCDVEVAVNARKNVVDQVKGSTGNMVGNKEGIPGGAAIIEVKFSGDDGDAPAPHRGRAKGGKIELARKGGHVHGPQIPEGSGEAKTVTGGAQVHKFERSPIKTDNFPPQEIPDLVA